MLLHFKAHLLNVFWDFQIWNHSGLTRPILIAVVKSSWTRKTLFCSTFSMWCLFWFLHILGRRGVMPVCAGRREEKQRAFFKIFQKRYGVSIQYFEFACLNYFCEITLHHQVTPWRQTSHPAGPYCKETARGKGDSWVPGIGQIQALAIKLIPGWIAQKLRWDQYRNNCDRSNVIV